MFIHRGNGKNEWRESKEDKKQVLSGEAGDDWGMGDKDHPPPPHKVQRPKMSPTGPHSLTSWCPEPVCFNMLVSILLYTVLHFKCRYDEDIKFKMHFCKVVCKVKIYRLKSRNFVYLRLWLQVLPYFATSNCTLTEVPKEIRLKWGLSSF